MNVRYLLFVVCWFMCVFLMLYMLVCCYLLFVACLLFVFYLLFVVGCVQV